MKGTKEEISDWLRKDMQETLDIMLNRNVGIEKYWEYLGKLILSRQLLGKMGDKLIVRVMVMAKGEGV